jgi:hypothetical protein
MGNPGNEKLAQCVGNCRLHDGSYPTNVHLFIQTRRNITGLRVLQSRQEASLAGSDWCLISSSPEKHNVKPNAEFVFFTQRSKNAYVCVPDVLLAIHLG